MHITQGEDEWTLYPNTCIVIFVYPLFDYRLKMTDIFKEKSNSHCSKLSDLFNFFI